MRRRRDGHRLRDVRCARARARARAQAGAAADARDRGSVAAELAVALPAVVLTLLLGAGAVGATAQQVLLQDAASDAARLLGRGESLSAAESIIASAVAGARMGERREGDLVCVAASVEASVGAVLRIPLTATSCALAGGL